MAIKTALCSFGMSGWVFHAPFIFFNQGFELYAVYERTKNLAAEKYPNIITYRSLEAMLADDAIELVIVNTPNKTHYEFAKKALLAGKHVVVEKPFAITATECDELIAIANNQNKKLSVYQNRRWDSEFLTLQKIVQQNLLGEIVEAEFHYDRFNVELSYKLHKEEPGGTGVLYDLGPHLIDQALQLFGMPTFLFADVDAVRSISLVDDYMEVILYYPTIRVRLKASILVREAVPAYALYGNKGTFLKPRADTQEARLIKEDKPNAEDWGTEPESGKGILHTEINGSIIREAIASEKGNYMEYYNQLHAAIIFDKPLPVTAQQGRDVVYIIEKAYESVQEKRIVEL
jgi:scyllo-inositol 2-dehydrogenase (NADP+)